MTDNKRRGGDMLVVAGIVGLTKSRRGGMLTYALLINGSTVEVRDARDDSMKNKSWVTKV